MKPTEINVSEHRAPAHDVEPLLVERWSARAMSGESLTDAELHRLFEAARWAPSSYNLQPWTFVYAKRDTPAWSRMFDTLVEFNQYWVHQAAVLITVVSKTVDADGKPTRTHSFDCGAAWQNIALQGTKIGLVVHGMQGFDYAQAAQVLAVPNDHQIEAMIAVGRPGPIDAMSERLQEREKPSERRPITELVREGSFA